MPKPTSWPVNER